MSPVTDGFRRAGHRIWPQPAGAAKRVEATRPVSSGVILQSQVMCDGVPVMIGHRARQGEGSREGA